VAPRSSSRTASRTLVLMRHAKSDWSGDEPDLDRPIGSRGKRQARESGRWLAEHLPGLDFVITSPAKRARSTWKAAAKAYGDPRWIDTDERIYTLDERDLLTVLREIDDDVASTLLIGHNPGLDELVTRLTGEQVDMVTSSLAVMTFEGDWSDLSTRSCRLIAHGRPPEDGVG
jgi:phosphohistidine phosphatase